MILGLKKDTSVEDYCCIFKTYLAFDKAKGFEKLGLDKVKTQWKKAKEFNDILKSITDIAEPDLIKQNQMVNLKRQPALSFHQFNNDFQQVKNGVTVKNYLIDIYTDGRIYLSIGPQRDRTQNKELFTMLSQKEVNKLLNEFDRLGFEQAPDRTFVGARSSYHMSDIERVHGLSGALQPSTYFITRRKQGTERTVIYDMLEIEKLPFPAKVLTLLENQLQTQKYRCGTIKDRSYYDFCVDKDNGFKLIAQ